MKKLIEDEYLRPYWHEISARVERLKNMEAKLTNNGACSLKDFASGHEFFGLHYEQNKWTFREWLPNATEVFLVGDFSDWKIEEQYRLTRIGDNWETELPEKSLREGDNYKLLVRWDGGEGYRIPAYARYVFQDDETKEFCAQIFTDDFNWKNPAPKGVDHIVNPLIYEAHVGMAQEEEKVGSYREFREKMLPRIIESGYSVLQLMAVMEHPYYGSFGYHVANFFASSSRFGTPSELKELIDAAHEAGLYVIMDIVHSHCVKNENEGLARLDGTSYQYFHDGARGDHEAWDSKCFDYSKPEVLHFLLSNCRFWLDEFNFDGFRFDGVTSMLYYNHGLGKDYVTYADYFDGGIDHDSETYLALANKLIHQVKPHAITVAEDMSGLPGLGAPIEDCGLGFDYKLAMGTPDFWYKLLETPDEFWNVNHIYHQLTNRRQDEKSITYVECHDQAIVGSKTVSFTLMGADMYSAMGNGIDNLTIDRGVALHKLIRALTLFTGGDGYLNFMGNEFGHPEWIDFPRLENNWSYYYARRQWSLADSPFLRYQYLYNFDKSIIKLCNDYNLLEGSLKKIYDHEDDKVLVFERDNLLFMVNLSSENSYVDYEIPNLTSSYKLLFSSDDAEYGGFERIEKVDHVYQDRFYLPNRTILIFKKIITNFC